MTPERWREVKSALERLTGLGIAERAAALAELRALDPELAMEAESLLAASPPDSFLESPAGTPPSVEPGTRVGSYEVLDLLGRGGMGEVWRARDTTLRRDVALKVLPVDVAQDPSRLARLRKEAQVLASLNHPCIAAIYGFEGSGPTPALVLELVQGQTLATRLSCGPLPVHDALRLSGQIAEALEAAHEHGIVHRDLKPGNVMLRPDGTVKVLDFGLATLGPEHIDAAATTLTLTQPGTIVGTPAYMAPEQARGESVDHRADVWAFGCVLYEMLTGRSAFGAQTVAESLANVLDGRVDLDALPGDMPPSIRRLVRRCLDPSLRNRLQHIGDARADVVDALAEHTGREVAPVSARNQTHVPITRPKARYLRGVLVAVGLVVVVAGAFLLMRSRGRAAVQGSEVSLPQSIRLTTTENATLPAISPDGNEVAYVQRSSDGDRLVIRQTSGIGKTITLVEPGAPIRAVMFTPDGQSVDYVTLESSQNTLRRVPKLGGTSKKLIERVDSALAWSPDKSRFAFLRLGPGTEKTSLILANAEDYSEETLISQAVSEDRGLKFSVWQLVQQGGPPRPAWSPDASTIAVPAIKYPRMTGLIMFVTVSNRSVTEVPVPEGMGGGVGGAWVDDGTLLWSMGQLYSVSYPSREFLRLTTDQSSYGSVSVSGQRDAFVAAQVDRLGEISILDRSGREESILNTSAAPPAGGLFAHLAWAGDRLLYAARSGDRRGIWAADAGNPGNDAEEWVRNASQPSASRDGSVIIYNAPRKDAALTLWKANGEGRDPTPVATSAFHHVIHPAGEQAVFVRTVDDLQVPWRVALDGGTPEKIAHVNARNPAISTDGRWLAFASARTGDDGVLRQVIGYCELQNCSPVSYLAAPGLPSTGTPIRWTPDGTGVAYVNAADAQNIWIQPRTGKATRLTRFTDGRTISGFAWAWDGNRLAVLRETTRTDIVLFRGILTRPAVQTP